MKESSLKYFWMLAFVLVPMVSFSQSSWEEVKKEEIVNVYHEIGKFYFEKSTYHVNFKYSSYRGHQSSVVHEQSKGNLKRNGKLICVESLGVKTIQDEKIKVIVDKGAKMIGVYHPEQVYYSGVNLEMNERNLTYAEKFYKRKSGEDTEYKILFRALSGLEKVVLKINKQYFLKQITNFYSNELEWEDPSGNTKRSKAKLKIEYDLISDGKLKESIEKTSQYVQLRGDKATLLSKYKGFELNDFRIK